MTARLVAAALVVAASAGVGACGGDDDALPTGAPPGARVFADANCGSCHALDDAGASGTAAADLDERRPDAATVERWVRKGGSGMPPFEDQLTDGQVRDVSRYVARVAGR